MIVLWNIMSHTKLRDMHSRYLEIKWESAETPCCEHTTGAHRNVCSIITAWTRWSLILMLTQYIIPKIDECKNMNDIGIKIFNRLLRHIMKYVLSGIALQIMHLNQWRPGYNFMVTSSPLQSRHNERDGVSNHQPHDCLPKRLFRHKSKETSKLRVTGPVTSPHKGPVTRKMFPFDDVIMPGQVSMVKLMVWHN